MEEKQEITIDAFQKCYQSREYHELKVLSERKTLLDIFGKTRSETIHSAMIAWCFENEEFNRIPEPSVLFLLRIAAIKAEQQKNVGSQTDRRRFMPDEIWEEVFANDIRKIAVRNVNMEESAKSPLGNGRTDITIDCCFNDYDRLRIVIENKVDSKEHDNQCSKYERHYDNLNDGYTTIYIFLAPDEPKNNLSSDRFIKITYQDILDGVLYPIYASRNMYSTRTTLYLEEYINTITSIRTNKILAMSKEVNELLKDFFNNNRDLIIAAIKSVLDDNDELKEKARAVMNSFTKYEVIIPGRSKEIINSHTAMAYHIAKYLAENHNRKEMIEKFGTLDNTSCSDKRFILEKAVVTKKNGKTAKLYTGKSIECKGGGEVWCSNQWVPNKVEKLKTLLFNEGIVIK